jgi:transposase
MMFCKECFKKQCKIDELEEKIVRLKAKIRHQDRTAKEGLFGSSTPSSKKPIKPNTSDEGKKHSGGGRPGHKGHGRSSVSEEEADRVEQIEVDQTCPDCGSRLEYKDIKERTVIDCEPVKMKKILYRLEQKRCPRCKKTIRARPPGVLPRYLYGNQLLSYVAVQHYIYGNTLGQIEKQTGVGYSSLVDALHQLARHMKDVPDALIKAYRLAPVKHADETGWRTDGQNGYAWLFCSKDISIFRIRNTRSAKVPHDVFGPGQLFGVLVVDRYNGYSKLLILIQYCYAHLLRNIQDLEKEFPQNAEIKSFVEALAPQLAGAMSLRTMDISDKQFKQQAAKIKRKIIQITNRPARHPAIQKIQDIFRDKADRLYHWADDRAVPADNNFAERELRPLVIARKVSFGSQSEEGARTRETIMSVLHTLKKRTPDVAAALKSALDKLAENLDLDLSQAIFNFDSS